MLVIDRSLMLNETLEMVTGKSFNFNNAMQRTWLVDDDDGFESEYRLLTNPEVVSAAMK